MSSPGRSASDGSEVLPPTAVLFRGSLEDSSEKQVAEVTRRGVPAEWTSGGIALVCSSGPVRDTRDPSQNVITMSGITRTGREPGGAMRMWFRHWKVSGSKLDLHPERALGPILFAMHTLSRCVLKLTAQMAPVKAGTEPVLLQIRSRSTGLWRTMARSAIDPLSRTVGFRVAKWDDTPVSPAACYK